MKVPQSAKNSEKKITHPAGYSLAPVQEVFSSFQGEGPLVGVRQIFVRFAHCHLKCAYCDTPMTSPTGQCHVKQGRDETLYENPLSPETLRDILVDTANRAKHHSVSFTGGEPLLYHRFLKDVFRWIKTGTDMLTYLETSGTQPEFLETVLPWCDIIAMDIKLPSATGEAAQWGNHRAFYALARTRPETDLHVKLVFNDTVTEAELAEVANVVTDPDTTVILQPQTGTPDTRLSARSVAVSSETIYRVADTLGQTFANVRVIPQTHKMLELL